MLEEEARQARLIKKNGLSQGNTHIIPLKIKIKMRSLAKKKFFCTPSVPDPYWIRIQEVYKALK
jgi:hypothetical protein